MGAFSDRVRRQRVMSPNMLYVIVLHTKSVAGTLYMYLWGTACKSTPSNYEG